VDVFDPRSQVVRGYYVCGFLTIRDEGAEALVCQMEGSSFCPAPKAGYGLPLRGLSIGAWTAGLRSTDGA
jgi:hypothetical protein